MRGRAFAGVVVAAAILVPTANASTASDIAHLKRTARAQARLIDQLDNDVQILRDRAADARRDARAAQGQVAHLYACLQARSAGTQNVLTTDTVSVFTDRYFYNEVFAPAIVAGGPDFVAYLRPACVGIETTVTGPLVPEATR